MSGRATRALAAIFAAILAAVAPTHAETPVLAPAGAPYTVAAPLEGKHGDTAADISGIACLPPESGGPRTCLTIDDESRKAQFVTIRGRAIEPGATLKLVGKKPSNSTLGRPPEATCPNGVVKSKDLDGEAVAYAAPFFYVSGSHGCARKKGTFQLSSFVLARVEVQGREVVAVETTYRLSDALRRDPKLLFANDLMLRNGLNLEGLAVVGDRLYAGLRAPSLQGNAFLVSVSATSLFTPGSGPLEATAQDGIIALHLGENTGVRDLAPLPDGRLLVLAGPAQEQADVPYALFVAEPRNGGALRKLGNLAPLRGAEAAGKAEAVAVLDSDRILVFFDGLPNGGPREYRIKLY